jgi:hypothetical protein
MERRLIGGFHLLSALFVAAGIASAQPTQPHIVPIDAVSALAVQVIEVEGGLSAATSQSLRVYGGSLARYSQSELEILIIASTPGANQGEAVAMRRALLVRDELAKASFLSRDRFLIQISLQTGLKNDPQETSIVVQPTLRSTGASDARRAQYVWAPESRRFVIICADGYVPVNGGSGAWPDDFTASRGCPQAASADMLRDRLRAEFNGLTGRWVLTCPNGEPLRTRAGDLDDFSAIRRCNR